MIRVAFLALVAAALLGGLAYAALSRGPGSFRAAFRRDAAAALARRAPQPLVTEADLRPLPAPVQRYLRVVGVVGRPRVQLMRARFRGALRAGPKDPWMPMTADQLSAFDVPVRLFRIDARRGGLPFEALHRFVGPSAGFAVKVASLVRVVDARGPDMDRSETVTFLNDMALLAPATLLSPAIAWEPVDDRTVRATFTMHGRTVAAELAFDEAGRLTRFTSDDRSMASADGRSFRAARWVTPVRDYRPFGPFLLASRGEAVWELPGGSFEYARLEILDVDYDPAG